MPVEINYYILVQDKNGLYRDRNYILYESIDSAKQAYGYYVENFPDEKLKLMEKVTTTFVEYQTLLSNDPN